jgi:hypothetical protein
MEHWWNDTDKGKSIAPVPLCSWQMAMFADTSIRKVKVQSCVRYVTTKKNSHKCGFKRIAVIFENLVFCNIQVSVLRDITSCVTVPVFQTAESHISEGPQCTHGCVNTQNHWHGKFIFKGIVTMTVVQNNTRILDFGFNTSVPKPS